MRLVGYIRVSRVGGREGDHFISPAVQRERVAQLAGAHGHTITEWIEDLDQSGATLQRPGMKRALELIQTGEADGLAVARLNRFARSVVDIELTVRQIEENGGVFLAADLGLDTTTPTGRLMRQVVAALAEFELGVIRENWQAARARSVARGVRGGTPPFGYTRGDDGVFVPDENAEAARALFERKADGVTIRQLAADYGMTTSTVRRILSSRTYLGEIHDGEHVNLDAHQPLIGRATWERAQGKRGVKRERKGSLLAGVIRCASCGHGMVHETGGARKYRGYRCVIHHADGACPAPAKIGAERAERYVVECLLAWASSVGVAAVAEQATDRLDGAITELEAAEAELRMFAETVVGMSVGQEALRAGLEARQRAVDEAQQRLNEERAVSPMPVVGSRLLADEFDRLPLVDRNAIVRAAFAVVWCSKAQRSGPGTPVEDRLLLVWRGQDEGRPSQLRVVASEGA